MQRLEVILFNYHLMLIKDIVNRLSAKQFPFRVLVNLTVNTVNFLSILSTISSRLLIELCKLLFVFSMLSVELQMPTYMRHMFEVYVWFILLFDVTFIFNCWFQVYTKNLQTLIMFLT
jgi:hypothetical protein